MGADRNDYRAAERRLLDAIRAGEVCDFADGAEITAEEMASWGPERTIRAALLRRLLTAEDARYATDGIRLRGAAVEGVLHLAGLNVLPLELQQCRIAKTEASGATFTRDATFTGTTFTEIAGFDGATFTETAGFDGATFTRFASFIDATFTGDAWFDDATFTGDARFDNATFTSEVLFANTTFTETAWFDRTTFKRDAGFDGATFTSNASFTGATFTGDARFDDATFTETAGFDGATFTGHAWFTGATFTSHARFRGATFTGTAWFGGAIADAYDFTRAQFHTTDPGPWVARRVTLTGAVFHVRARVAVAAVAMDCRRMQAREGVHLVVRGGVVDLADVEFLRWSILENSPNWPAVPGRQSPGKRTEGFGKVTLAEQARWTAQEKAFQFAKKLVNEFGSEEMPQTQVVSLRRATASDLELSGVGLEDCAFAGAHGLDKVRIGVTCSFQRPPMWPRGTWRPFTRRRVIFEEAQWRRAHTRGWAMVSTTATATPERDDPVPTALEIAGIYRDLRKGLEDAKDEPGAGDFYYGEMEMRRLAQPRRSHNAWTWAAEHELLNAYWAVSGYGLRAWRALTALTVLLLACAALFTLPVFAHLPAVPQHVSSVNLRTGALRYAPGPQPSVIPDTSIAVTFGTSLEFTATESLTLIRASGTPLLQTTGAGTVVDIAVRLLAPLLLGLAVLAVRGRTKR